MKQRNIDELLKEKNKQNEVKKSWKQRIIESFEIDEDEPSPF